MLQTKLTLPIRKSEVAALDVSAMEVDTPGDLAPVNVETTSKRSKKEKKDKSDAPVATETETPSKKEKKEKSEKKKKRKSEAAA